MRASSLASARVLGRAVPFDGVCVLTIDPATVENDDGSMTVRFGDHGDLPNSIPITEGWNYLVRLYRPRPEILDGT